MSIKVKERPKLTREAVEQILKTHGLNIHKEGVICFAIRGYRKRTMGDPNKNDRGIYDDLIGLITENTFAVFNGNTDPSRVRKGRGKGVGKGMATLKPGLYRAHVIGQHKKVYPALVQRADKVTVIRDGLDGDYLDTGFFGINIHPGGTYGTSSLGCQTIPRQDGEWDAFIALAVAELKRRSQKVLPYLLVENV